MTTAYKFRSASQIEFIVDILDEKKLYCSAWNRLNELSEGLFEFSSTGDAVKNEQLKQRLTGAKNQLLVCSLSEDYADYLLWTHYAGGFNGVAIEVELPESPDIIRKVIYENKIRKNIDGFDPSCDVDELAKQVLCSKFDKLRYEQEIRVFSDTELFPVDVRRVIVGPGMPKTLPKEFSSVCRQKKIKLCRATIDDAGKIHVTRYRK
ncbi:MAG TPA: DUF2971 domain-containing protein [Armatimonadota bacterium]|jgi:hypothetical protein